MKPWSTFFRTIAPEVGECPAPTMEHAIKEAAIDFYSENRVWRVEGVILATTVIGQREYTVTSNPADTILVGLPVVWVGDEEVDEAAPGASDDVDPGYNDTAWSVRVVGDAKIRVTPGPVAAGDVIKATAAYAPGSTALGLDDKLYAQHHKAIEHKALSRLMRQKTRPWYDPSEASRHAQEELRETLWISSQTGPTRRNPLRTKQP